jgi:hypothetical protein
VEKLTLEGGPVLMRLADEGRHVVV